MNAVRSNHASSADPRLILQRELERRCQSNPRYSLRAFAKALQMSPTVLSLVLSGKRPLSKKAAIRIANLLTLSHEECAALTRWADRTKKSWERLPQIDDATSQETDAYQMSLDSFALVSDWYHYAILSLLEIPEARFEARWIARHLGINEIEAKGAMERLVRMEIVDRTDGRWKQVVGPIRIGNDVPTSATKKFQKQLLLKAIDSIDNDPSEIRDFSSMTIAMNSAQVPYARERIRSFRRALAEELEAKGAPDRAYKITMQVFPVSQSVKESRK